MPLDFTGLREQAGKLDELGEREFKVVERRARRIAERRGLELQRSRRRDPGVPDYGRYRLAEARSDQAASGDAAQAYSLTLADVLERLLGGDEVDSGEVVELVGADGKPAPTLVRGRPR